MKRRAFLGGLACAFGGCSTLPGGETESRQVADRNLPNLFFEYERQSARTVEIIVVEGNTVRASDGWDVGVMGTSDGRVMWVAETKASRQSFPLTVGDSITVSVDSSSPALALIYSKQDSTSSVGIDRYELESPTPTGTDR